MIRLRSDRWFSAEGQTRSRGIVRSQSSGTRRLISLCFLLALVILLMRKAADPAYVSNAFRSLGVPLEASPQFATETRVTTKENGKWTLTCDDLVPRLLDRATETQIRHLSESWFRVFKVDRHRLPAAESSIGLVELKRDSLAMLQTMQADLAQDEQDWSEQLARFRSEWMNWWQVIEDGELEQAEVAFTDAETSVPGISDELGQSISVFLDTRLVQSLKDAAPWSANETTAFWRLLQLGMDQQPIWSAPDLSVAPKISTLQLESESKSLKGKRVRFRGSVRRLDFVERANQRTGTAGYWLAWLRGDDGSSQPVAVYSMADEFTDLKRDFSPRLGFAKIEVVAVVGKRLAYASEAGVQVAPTLFATGLQVLDLPSVQSTPDRPSNWTQDLTLALLGGALLAGFLCCSIFGKYRRAKKALPSSRSARTRTTGCITLTLASLLPLGSPVKAQDTTPPWAQTENEQQSLQAIVGERLQPALAPDSIATLTSYVEARADGFPDATLQAIHTLNQLGWQRALETEMIISTPANKVQLRKVRLSGLVSQAKPVNLSESQKAWYQRRDEDGLYLLSIEPEATELLVAGKPQTAGPNATDLPVFCQEIPAQWSRGTGLRQPMQIEGFGLFESSSVTPICVLAHAPKWVLPDADWSGFVPPIPAGFNLLGRLQWNLTFADLVVANNQQPLRSSEAEAFYSMLNLLDSSAGVTAVSKAAGKLGPLDVLSEPGASFGQAVRWPVRLVTCSIVEVEPGAGQVLGSNRYFQFDGFVNMGNQRVRYQVDGAQPADDLVFEREFPITLVMKGTSEFTPQAELAVGNQSWPVGKFAEVEGCFYRLWSFESELLQSKRSDARQTAPLVVATSLRRSLPPHTTSSGTGVGWFGYALCFATLVILAAILFSVSTSGRSTQRM